MQPNSGAGEQVELMQEPVESLPKQDGRYLRWWWWWCGKDGGGGKGGDGLVIVVRLVPPITCHNVCKDGKANGLI
jgi:hypothetical protein